MVNFSSKSESMFVKILELIPKLVFVSKQCTLEFFWTTNLVGLNPSGLPPSSQCKTCSTNFPCKNQTFVFSLSANWYFHLISQVFVVPVTVDFCHQFARLLAFSENWGQYGNFEVMLLKSEHKEGGGSRDTMEQSELSQAMETKKEDSCFQFSDIFLFRLSLAL